MALPIPLFPPVTIATLPFSDMAIPFISEMDVSCVERVNWFQLLHRDLACRHPVDARRNLTGEPTNTETKCETLRQSAAGDQVMEPISCNHNIVGQFRSVPGHPPFAKPHRFLAHPTFV
jgi:hypothetical protein